MNEYSQYIGPIVVGALLVFLLLRSKKKKSDPKPTPVEPSEPSTPGTVTPTKIDHSKVKVLVESSAPRMMSAIYHGGLLGFGTYRDNSQNYVLWEDRRKVAVGGRSEAVYRMSSIDGAPIANLEKESNTHDAVTGEISSRNHYDMVTDTIRVGTKSNGDALFASVSATKFGGDIGFRIHDRNLKRVVGGNWYCRGVFKKWGRIHICAHNYNTEEGGLLISPDGVKAFNWHPIFKSDKYRPMHVADFGNRVAIAFSKYKGGKRQGGGLVLLNEDLSYYIDKFSNEHGGWFEVVTDGENIYCSALEWKGDKSGAIWWRDKDGRWSKIYETDGPGEVLGLVLTDYGTLGAAIREHGKAKGIEIGDRSNKPKQPEHPSIEELGGGFVWKPVSEGDHKLVVLLPSGKEWDGKTVFVNDEQGRYIGRTNGNRPTYRFSKPGSQYPNNSVLSVGAKKWIVPDPGKRYD